MIIGFITLAIAIGGFVGLTAVCLCTNNGHQKHD